VCRRLSGRNLPTTITPQPPSRLKLPAYRSFAAPCLKTVRLARSCSRLVRWARKRSRYKCGAIVRHGRKRPTGDICIHRVGRNLQIHRDRQPPGQNRTRFGRHAAKQTREAWRGEPSTSSVSRIAVVGGDCPETWGNCVQQSYYHRCGREHSRQREEPHGRDRGDLRAKPPIEAKAMEDRRCRCSHAAGIIAVC
jgi:hypothetical protein